MATRDFNEMTHDLRDTIKWIATSIITIGTAVAGAAVLTRLGNVSGAQRTLPTFLAFAALVSLLLAAGLAVWALSVPEPKLTDLVPESTDLQPSLLAQQPDEAIERHASLAQMRRKQLDADVAKAAPIAQFKYESLADLGGELRKRRQEWLQAVSEAGPGTVGKAWADTLPKTAQQLATVYADLRDVSDGLRLVRTQRRTGIALPLIVFAGGVVVASMIPFVAATQPAKSSPPAAAPITTATAVNVFFLTDPRTAKSSEGCIPRLTDVAHAIGGTWTRPLLVFSPESSAKDLLPGTKRTGKCTMTSTWVWQPTKEGEVSVTPRL